MNAKKFIALLPLAIIFFSGASAPEDSSIFSERNVSLAQKLASDDMQVRTAAWSRVRSQREATIAALLQVARAKEQDFWTKLLKSRAIEVLGEYRAEAAVNVLIDEIEAPPGHGFVDGPEPSRDYPTVQALINVGEPAISRILTIRMAKPISERQLKLFSYVIWLYYAPHEEQEVGLFRMERLLARERNARKQATEQTGRDTEMSVREKNLARLIDIYKAIGPGGPTDWPKQRYTVDAK